MRESFHLFRSLRFTRARSNAKVTQTCRSLLGNLYALLMESCLSVDCNEVYFRVTAAASGGEKRNGRENENETGGGESAIVTGIKRSDFSSELSLRCFFSSLLAVSLSPVVGTKLFDQL